MKRLSFWEPYQWFVAQINTILLKLLNKFEIVIIFGIKIELIECMP